MLAGSSVAATGRSAGRCTATAAKMAARYTELKAFLKSSFRNALPGRNSAYASSCLCTASVPARWPTANWCTPHAAWSSFDSAWHTPRAAVRRRTEPHAMGRTPPLDFGSATSAAPKCAATASAGASPSTSRVRTTPAASSPLELDVRVAQCSKRLSDGPGPLLHG